MREAVSFRKADVVLEPLYPIHTALHAVNIVSPCGN